MSRGRKRSRDQLESSEIFMDADFDADEFVDQMEEKTQYKSGARAGWRRLEQLREEKLLLRELQDFDDYDDFS